MTQPHAAIVALKSALRTAEANARNTHLPYAGYGDEIQQHIKELREGLAAVSGKAIGMVKHANEPKGEMDTLDEAVWTGPDEHGVIHMDTKRFCYIAFDRDAVQDMMDAFGDARKQKRNKA